MSLSYFYSYDGVEKHILVNANEKNYFNFNKVLFSTVRVRMILLAID